MSTGPAATDRQWFIVGRWQEYAGEIRANLLRIIAISAFYGIELLNYHGLELGFLNMARAPDLTREFHAAVTALAVAWTMVAVAVHLCIRQRYFPAALKFASTVLDLLILTGILAIADGPRSPLVVGYFLVIALTTLRFNLSLIRLATLGSICGYVVLLGHDRWFRSPAPAAFVPRYQQLIVLLALAMTGLILGQVIRRVSSIAREYAVRLSKEEVP
jgi:hypothetical protein